MDKNSFICIGNITKVHGFKGEVVFYCNNLKIDFNKINVIFIEIDSDFIPFFISYVKKRDYKSYFISFEGFTTSEDIKFVTSNKVYLPLSNFAEEEIRELYPSNIKGYNVIDINLGNIGIIDEIINIPGNDLLKIVTTKNKEAFIPMVNKIVLNIDHQLKQVFVETPKGLIEIYNNEQ
ncbi:MAG TPA: ribosome maturation factor RimM [Bacteroidales bacterium]|nr:ribosome maturation factor RimM [Bacteroidales bacterium]